MSKINPALTDQNIVPKLAGKNVLISGGTTGIGRATALQLAQAGANILIFGRNKKELKDALHALDGLPGDTYGLVADQAEKEDVKAVFAEAKKRFKTLDILINNAAGMSDSINDGDEDDWRYELHANLFGYIDCTRRAVKWMRPEKSGHIVNVGSVSAYNLKGGSSLYVAAKSAIQGYTESLRQELMEENIKVSLIEPGSVGTDLFEGEPEEDPKVQRKLEKQGKMMKAEDIAAAIYYCISQPARCTVSLVRVMERNEDQD